MSSTKNQNLVDITTLLLGEYVTDEYSLRLEAPDTLLECHASITVIDPAKKSISPSELISILRTQEISTAIDMEQVAIFCTGAAQGENPQKVVLARGQEPQTGEDGWFELIVNTGKE